MSLTTSLSDLATQGAKYMTYCGGEGVGHVLCVGGQKGSSLLSSRTPHREEGKVGRAQEQRGKRDKEKRKMRWNFREINHGRILGQTSWALLLPRNEPIHGKKLYA
jgi:hypothetical protein